MKESEYDILIGDLFEKWWPILKAEHPELCGQVEISAAKAYSANQERNAEISLIFDKISKRYGGGLK